MDTQYLKIFQKGFNYSQDGRGNRLVLHLQGCNMRCPWCANPEGLSPDGELMTDSEWLTESSCPEGAVSGSALDRSRCAVCEKRPCLAKRQKGIRLSCRDCSLEDLLEECIRSKPMFFDGGGVTLTGGEVSVQFEGVLSFLKLLGAEKIHRAIECNGTHPRMPQMVPYVDQWIMDVKHYDEETHRAWTGVSNRRIIRNLETISAIHPDMLVRIPLIPGFNDRKEDAEGFAALLSSKIRKQTTKIELLTYHEFGKGKWAQCGKTYTMPSASISPETVQIFEKKLTEKGIACVKT